MEWISVKDRLPEYDAFVIGCDAAETMDIGQVNYISGEFFDLDGEPAPVTHWMPLPELPRKEKCSMNIKQQKPIDFRIVSAPVKIAFDCPHCEEAVEIPWRDVAAPDGWNDVWPSVDCPECGKSVELGEWEYD